MQGGAKPPGPLAFEPIDPPKRQISRQPPPATEPALWGRAIGNRGGGHSCTYKLGSDYELADGAPGGRSADSTIFAASGSPVSRRCAAASLPRQVPLWESISCMAFVIVSWRARPWPCSLPSRWSSWRRGPIKWHLRPRPLRLRQLYL